MVDSGTTCVVVAALYCVVCCGGGGLMSLTCGMVGETELGTPPVRGGGGCLPSACGCHAVLVCIFRFEEAWVVCEEEKERRTCWQGRKEEHVGDGAKRKTELADEARGENKRCTGILRIEGRS